MKNNKDDFKILKENPKNDDTNYIFQNNKITRVGFYIVGSALLIGIVMVVIAGITV